jgi:hypothetical protein
MRLGDSSESITIDHRQGRIRYPFCGLEACIWAFGNQPADKNRLAVDQSDNRIGELKSGSDEMCGFVGNLLELCFSAQEKGDKSRDTLQLLLDSSMEIRYERITVTETS